MHNYAELKLLPPVYFISIIRFDRKKLYSVESALVFHMVIDKKGKKCATSYSYSRKKYICIKDKKYICFSSIPILAFLMVVNKFWHIIFLKKKEKKERPMLFDVRTN